MSEPTTELVIPDEHGELIPVKTALTERIAAFVDDIAERRREIAEWEAVANDELLDRMDFEAATTLRVGEFELKAPSPTAGTTAYDPVALDEQLGSLVGCERISAAAASAALKRGLTLNLKVSWDTTPGELAEAVEHAVAIHIAGHEVKVLSASGSLTPALPGINRLRKLGLDEDLDAALVPTPAPRRRVKVTRKARS